MRTTKIPAVAIGIILVAAATVTIVVGGNVVCGKAPQTLPPCAGQDASPFPTVPSVSLVIAPEGIDDQLLNVIDSSFRPYLATGDVIMLSSGAGSNNSTVDPHELNSWVGQLKPNLPSGIGYEARTGGLANVRNLSSGLSSSFEAVVYDYEPNFETEFSLNFSITLQNFESFSSICHTAGFRAFGYPTGQPIDNSQDRTYGWNYGELNADTGVQGLQIQLQGAAHDSEKAWNNSIQTLIGQYAGYGLAASSLSVQLTLAQGDPNNISVTTAYADYEYAIDHGVGQIILWWNLASEGDMMSMLNMIRG
jgi:hypothetical protein